MRALFVLLVACGASHVPPKSPPAVESGKIAVCITSEKGDLANLPYRLLDGDRAVASGTTDAKGCLEHRKMPLGHHVVTIDRYEPIGVSLLDDDAEHMHPFAMETH